MELAPSAVKINMSIPLSTQHSCAINAVLSTLSVEFEQVDYHQLYLDLCDAFSTFHDARRTEKLFVDIDPFLEDADFVHLEMFLKDAGTVRCRPCHACSGG